MSTQRFPDAWLHRVNEVVKAVRRQQGYTEVFATVEAPRLPGYPPTLRLEFSGATEIVPLSLPAVEQLVRTGQPGPLLVEIRQGFLRVIKFAERRGFLQPDPKKRARFR